MFCSKTNTLQLTSLLLRAGITHVVVSPGSRNAPLVHNFREAGMQLYEITDERSAAFFALGLMESNGGHPVAVCVTSGSAVLNVAPAVSEAYYRSLPLLVITADRPQRWIGQMDGQTMNQDNAFANYIRKSVTLPEPDAYSDSATTRDSGMTLRDEERWHCNRLINEALIALRQYGGPVHINVPITEPMFDFSVPQLPDERLISYASPLTSPASFTLDASMCDVWRQSSSRMLIVGQMLPEQATALTVPLVRLAMSGITILAEPLSNLHLIPELHDYVVTDFDQLITASASPELLITFGGHIVSKRLKQYLRQHQPLNHWHISPIGEVADLYMNMTSLLHATPQSVLSALMLEMEDTSTSVPTSPLPIGEAYAEAPYHLDAILSSLPMGYNIHVANSSMVRHLQQAMIHHQLTYNPVFCNRGINGIEGSSSTAVGYWAGSGEPTLLLTGDLSFFYDQNALWNNFVKSPQSPLRIVIINNGRGDIFSHVPGLSASPHLDRYIAAAHTTSAEGMAAACGADYARVSTPSQLASILPGFFDTNPSVRILEIFVGYRL